MKSAPISSAVYATAKTPQSDEFVCGVLGTICITSLLCRLLLHGIYPEVYPANHRCVHLL